MPKPPSIFNGPGEMRAIMRAYNWDQSPLGPVEHWPQSLQTTVQIVLSSRYAMWMAWGPELTFFYNDTYGRVTLGKKHPWALGRPAREVWSEIWGDLLPRIQTVFDTGEATWDEGLLLFLERSGFPEETYHTFSYSPLTDDDGNIAGMLCVVTEETDRVLGERQLGSLRDLAEALTATATEQEVFTAVGRSLQLSDRDLPFTLTYILDGERSTARLGCSTGFAAGDVLAPASIDFREPGVWPIAQMLAEHRPVMVDLSRYPSALPRGGWSEPPLRAVLVPIAGRGEDAPAGVLIAGLNRYRNWNEDYRGYIDLVAGQIAGSLGNAYAYEQERKRAEALAELDRAKTTFFSNVSHELRTPLTLMLGPLEDELNRSPLDGRNSGSLDLIYRNALRLLKLVNTLLEFSRVESGRIKASYQPVDLAELTSDLASTFRSAVERAGLQFIVACDSVPEPVYVDTEMWEKVVLNLISNAFKSGRMHFAQPEWGTLKLRT